MNTGRKLTEAMTRIDRALEEKRLLSPEELVEIRDLIEAGQEAMYNEIDRLNECDDYL